MPRSLLVVLLVIAGCSTEATPSVTLLAPGATWMAVRTTEEPAWRRVDGGMTEVATDGDFEAAVVCREDIGGGWTWLATPGDAEEGDDGVRRFEDECQSPGGATVVFDVTGDVYGIFVGTGATYGPTYYSTEVQPGVHDVVAVRNAATGRGAERVQILRGVRIAPGMNRIAIDVEAMGQPVATATVQVNGVTPYFSYQSGYTAGGTWFRLEGATVGEDLVVLPAALRVDGDRDLAEVHLEDDRWLQVAIREGANALTTEAPVIVPTFVTGDASLQMTWPATATDRWDRVRISSWRVVDSSTDYPGWWLSAYPGAIERRTTGGSVTLTMSAPDLAGFQRTWFTDHTMPHRRIASWQRERPDGVEGYGTSETIRP